MIEHHTQKRFRPNKKDKKIKRRCKYCSIEFTTLKKSKQQVCSKRCPAKVFTYACAVCGKRTSQAICWGEGKFCSEGCRQTWYYSEGVVDLLPPGMHVPVNPKQKRRKAKVLAGDPIDKQSVFEFYGYVCILCDEPIDKSLHWPDPMSASLEHIVPLSEGGTHTWDNVAPAHLLCNNNKDSAVETYLLDKCYETYRKIVEAQMEDVNGCQPTQTTTPARF